MAIITVTGYVGKADMKVTPSGTYVLSVSIADKRWNYREEQEETYWIRVAWFGERAEKLANSIPRAKILSVTGKEAYKIYDGKIDRSIEPMDHQIIQFKPNEDQPPRDTAPQHVDYQYPTHFGDDDLPY